MVDSTGIENEMASAGDGAKKRGKKGRK